MVADVIVETPDTVNAGAVHGQRSPRLQAPATSSPIDPHQFEALERFTSFLETPEGQA